MKRLLSILLAVAMVMAFAVPAMAAEEAAEPTVSAHAYHMTYYAGGYGAMPGRYQCNVDFFEQGYGYGDWFDISFGDPIVENWPTEVGTYTVTFEKTTAIEGAGDTEYTFNISMDITVLELPATSGKCGDDMTWKFDTATDTLTVSGTGDMYTVAETDEDFQNSNFGYEPGWWYLPVKHIVIEEGVEKLSNYAFTQAAMNGYYKILETIQLPTTLKAIPELGFLMADAMTSLTIPEGITSLTGWPFGYPGNSFLPLTDLYLPSTLTQMDYLTLLVSGLDSNTAEQTLKAIHFAGTKEQWEAITRVDSEIIKEIYKDDYEGFYEGWCVPAKDFVEKLVVFEPKKNIPVENGTATIPDSSVEITKGEDVVIDVTNTKEKVSSVVIGAATVDKIADAEAPVEIKLPDATVSFDKTAIGSISQQAQNKDITIVATEINKDSLNDKQKASLVKEEVHGVLDLQAHAGKAKITDFGGGKVTVSILFVVPEDKTGADFYVAYLANDGKVTDMPTSYKDGFLTFETYHFSNYVILEKASNPATADATQPVLLALLMLASAACLFVCIRKRAF